MKRIVIDARMISLTGIGRYIVNLLENLQDLDRENQYVVLVQPRDKEYWRARSSNFRTEIVNAPEYTFREQVFMPFRLRRLKPDLVHFTTSNAPITYRGRFVITVHDLTLLKFRNVRRSRVRYEIRFRAFGAVIAQAVRRAAVVITPTDFGRQELGRFFGKEIIKKAVVTPLAFDPASTNETLPKDSVANIATPFLLYVGNYFPYKNILRLIEAMPAIIKNHPDIKLVLAGNTGYFGSALKRRSHELDIEDRVVFTGYISDAEKNHLYKAAELFVFPSLSEGFGIPGLEAMSHGLPVAAARATALPEVYGAAAAYFNPKDAGEIASMISGLLASPSKLAALKKAGAAQINKFSWKRTASQTLDAYNKALD